jgi:hypothetical protein
MAKGRNIPSSNEIKAFFHCKLCLEELPEGMSPRNWVRMECGWTELGFQVWCLRHDVNIVHVDFQGRKHPANLSRLPNGSRQ